MDFKNDLMNNKFVKWLFFIMAVFFILGIIIVIPCFAYELKYNNKIYPGVTIGYTDMGGKTIDEARRIINQKIDLISKNGFVFRINNEDMAILPTINSFEADTIHQIILFDAEETIKNAFAIGRSNSKLENAKDKISSLLYKRKVNTSNTYNEKDVIELLKSNFSQFEIQPQNANLVASSSNNLDKSKITFEISSEKTGKVINYQEAITIFEDRLNNLDEAPIYLRTSTENPTITKNECLNMEKEAQEILTLAPILLQVSAATSSEKNEAWYIKNKDLNWEISKEMLAGWMTLSKNDKSKIIISLNETAVKDYLKNEIASSSNEEAKNARLTLEEGRVTEFQSSQNGFALDINANLEKMRNDIFITGTSSINLVFINTEPNIKTEDVNNLGIKEIIGTGHSNFSGSPVNRRHNINVGTDYINGLIIKPDEEFSLVKALGTVDAASGYLPELVIKGNKTIPEYGGGLCQVATTLFRAAIQSGLPITARSPHSYRVSYYEPAGTDAAVYLPRPDVKFINDTGNNILIQVRSEGNDLYFDFWGQKDERKIEISDPVVYNINWPGPTKIIETTDLAPGQKKCTESAHPGADAYFDYKVTYNNGEIKEERFSSHYVPWQAVCLVGVETSSSENDTQTNEDNIETNNPDNTDDNVNTNNETTTENQTEIDVITEPDLADITKEEIKIVE